MKILGSKNNKNISSNLTLSECNNIIKIQLKCEIINLSIFKRINSDEYFFSIWQSKDKETPLFSSNISKEELKKEFYKGFDMYLDKSSDEIIKEINKEIVENCFIMISNIDDTYFSIILFLPKYIIN